MTLSLRFRLTLWCALVLLASLLALGVGISFTLEHRLLADVDSDLAQRVSGLKTVSHIEGENATPVYLASELDEFAQEISDGALLEVHDEEGNVMLPASGLELYPKSVWTTPGYQTIRLRGQSLRLLTRDYEDRGHRYTATVGKSLEPVQTALRELRYLEAAAIPVMALLAWIGGYWISRRALAPVDEITQVAKSISVQNLSRRLPVPATGDELQRMSEAWNDVLERLESALLRVRQFTADASHELRTPVALIRATAELALRRDRASADYRSALENVHSHAEHMTHLTDALLAMAQVDAGSVALPLTPTDLNSLLHEVGQQVAALAQERAIRLEILPAAEPAIATVNADAVRRLLLILVENALKYTPADGRVTLSVATSAEGILLSVHDSGRGIDPAALPHIFERFFRSDSARSTNQGTGLGLAIAQAIAHAHGTVIEAHSELGNGSLFRLCFRG